MNRLQAELNRLYLTRDRQIECQDPADPYFGLIDANGQVRAMVMEVARQAGWDGVAALWQGIQDDFDLPAPVIAVSGIDGYQVWFSLLEPVTVARAQDFLELLRLRYLGAIAPRHIGMKPAANTSEPLAVQHSKLVPALQAETGRWSAFVAPGLANMFADEPWLDVPPSPEAQANILSHCDCIKPADFQMALERLKPVSPQASNNPQSAPIDRSAVSDKLVETKKESTYDGTHPKRFLHEVMNDSTAELHLRIEAAKALLPYFEVTAGVIPPISGVDSMPIISAPP